MDAAIGAAANERHKMIQLFKVTRIGGAVFFVDGRDIEGVKDFCFRTNESWIKIEV